MNIKIIERDVLNPLADTDSEEITLKSIPKKIESLALLDNTKPGADIVLDTIRDILGYNKVVEAQKPAGAPGTDEEIKLAAGADLCILALGDCGSCTTWLILDAIRLEKQGTPTISVCSDIFTPFARELAESYGASNLRIVEVEHPLAGQPKGSIVDKTRKAAVQIKAMLNNGE